MATTVRARPERTSAPTTRARPRWLGGALVAVVLVGAGFRLWGLGANRLGYDEAFTAMAGRLPLGSLFGYLRAHDSHPPLDYLLHLPLARLGVSAFWLRMPGVLCSIAALGLFAWWMRDRGRVGVLATAIMACSAFEIVHGREARMYAELELLGVAVAMLAYAWLQAPRRRHAYLLGILVLLGLLTHVSMFLVGAGLLALPGGRRDREAWRWRGAIAAAGAGWAALWGSSFLVQARGGHSDWIPRTTPGRVVDTVSSLVTQDTAYAVVIVLAVAAGGLLLVRSDRRMGRVWCACFVVPLTLAAVAGLAAPVLLDRTLTMVAWAPMFAIAVVLDRLLRRAPVLGIAAVVVAGLLVLPPSFSALAGSTAPDRALRRLEAVARPGDVVAVRAAGKAPEVQWTLGVRGHQPWKPVTLTDVVPTVAGLRLGGAAPTGRIWILDWNSRVRAAPGYQRCAPDRHFGVSRILCLRRVDAGRTEPPPTRAFGATSTSSGASTSATRAR